MRVTVLGLGNMGFGIAQNLIAKGIPTTVYNRTPAKAAALAAQGASAAATPREAAEDADVVISMVADDPASRAVWLGPDGALAGAPAGSKPAVLVECSTLSLGWVAELAGLAALKGLVLLDSPVTGSKGQAVAGQLGLLVGGNEAALEAARPALEAFSSFIIHLGPSGSGALMKLINNMMGAVQAANLAEALVLAERAGLDMGKVVQLLSNGAPGSGMVKAKIGVMASRGYQNTQFALKLMRKDATYALRAAEQFGAILPTVAAAREVYGLAENLGFGEADVAAVIEVLALRAKTD